MTEADVLKLSESDAARRDRAIAENNQFRQEIAELMSALRGMVGLIDLLCSRPDISPEFKKVTQENHRVVRARRLLGWPENADPAGAEPAS